MTKNNTKMAFIKIENKVTEQEVVVFPNIYEQFGGKLLQDNVIKIVGRVNATDKTGRPTSDIKVLAESIELISDDELDQYQSTGNRLPPPATNSFSRSKPTRTRNSIASKVSTSAPPTPPTPPTPAPPQKTTKLFRIRPPDTSALTQIRQLCELNSGSQEVILVLQEETIKRPIRMSFKIHPSPDLLDPLAELLGADCVKLQ